MPLSLRSVLDGSNPLTGVPTYSVPSENYTRRWAPVLSPFSTTSSFGRARFSKPHRAELIGDFVGGHRRRHTHSGRLKILHAARCDDGIAIVVSGRIEEADKGPHTRCGLHN